MGKVTDMLKTGDISEEAYDMVFSCSQGCGQICMKACPEMLMPNLIFMWLVSKIKQSGRKMPPYAYQYDPEYPHNFASVFSAIQNPPEDKRWIKEIPENPEPVDIVLFCGCAANGMPHLVISRKLPFLIAWVATWWWQAHWSCLWKFHSK